MKQVYKIILGLESLLMIPLVAMQFSDEIQWSFFDFLIMAILLLVLGLGIHLILKKVKTKGNQWAWIFIALVLFFLFWAELAVGIFGTPFAGN